MRRVPCAAHRTSRLLGGAAAQAAPRRPGTGTSARRSSPYASASHPMEEECVAGSDDRRGIAGISLGGIIVIVGVVLMFVWSFWIGLIIALVGLVAFGGFARGKWY
jgi:hypothetical protein